LIMNPLIPKRIIFGLSTFYPIPIVSFAGLMNAFY